MKPQKARRQKQKAVVGFIAPSGAGKTVSMLIMAYGMMKEAYPEATEEELWDKIGVADTEHSRSQLYWNETFDDVTIGEFWHIDFQPPYTTDRYNKAVQELKGCGCEVVIVDSLSHNWQGEGGIIEQHSSMSGNSFQNWGKLSSETTSLVKTLTRNNVHILAGLRTKQEYVVEQNEDGKSVPKKLGLKPVQKDDMEYEFMINFNIDMSHVAQATKDNSRLFANYPKVLTAEDGAKLFKWLELGVDVKAEERDRRLSQLAFINSVRENEQVDYVAKEIEAKTSMKIEDMIELKPSWFDAAFKKIEAKSEEIQ